jgi:hypothetical protein
VSVSGIHDFRRSEAGFPIRIASGMTVSGTGGRLTLIRFLFVYVVQSMIKFAVIPAVLKQGYITSPQQELKA